MTCIIVDDEPHAIEVLKGYAEQTELLTLKASFRNPVKALDFLRLQSVDLIFLDISMPHLTGMQFLQALRIKPLVIFTTAHSTYGAESYDYDALDYLLKPVSFDRFLKAVHKAADTLHEPVPEALPPSAERMLLLKSGGQVHYVPLKEITHICKEDNYLVVHAAGRKVLIRGNMTDVFDIFPVENFCRIHKSHVVALRHITMVEQHHVSLGKVKLALGPTYRSELLERLAPTK